MPQTNPVNQRPASSLPTIDEQATLKRARDAAIYNGVTDPGRLFLMAMQMTSQFDHIPHPKLLDIAVTLLREGLAILPPGHSNQALALDGLGQTLRKRFSLHGERGDLVEAIAFNRQALGLCTPDDPDRSVALNNLANTLQDNFYCCGDQASLDEAISLHLEALELRPTPHPLRHWSLSNLALSLTARFDILGQRGDLEKAISLYHEALVLIPNALPDRAFPVNGLASALLKRFKLTGELGDLQNAIANLREMIPLLPSSHHYRPTCLFKLGDLLTARFALKHQREDLEEAITFLTEALQLHPIPGQSRSGPLNSLAVALGERFGLLGGLEDLEQKISLYREALTLMSATQPQWPSVVDNLSAALINRFIYLGRQEDLNEAISLSRETLEGLGDFHSLRATVQNHLANAFLIEFEYSGCIDVLDDAISLHRKAIKPRAAPQLLRLSSSLNDLGRCLTARFQELGRLEDLKEAQALLREALTLQNIPSTARCSLLSNLSVALMVQFHETMNVGELEEAISLLREAIELHDSSSRASSLGNLAIALRTRYDQTRQRRDLEEAIALNREALKLKPSEHAGRADTVDNLGVALKRLFDDSGEVKYLDEAIVLHEETLELRPEPHIRRSNSLNNVAVALKVRYDCLKDTKDLDKAIYFNREAERLRAAPHPLRFHVLNNLALVLYSRSTTQSVPTADLKEAIELYKECLKLLVSGHPQISRVGKNLGQAFVALFSYTHDADHLENAVSSFRNAVACGSSPTFQRFLAAREWASLTDTLHESSLEAYEAAIELLPRLAALALDVEARHHILTSGTDGLARNAASCAIRAGKYEKAIELLEEGRAVFWSQSLQLRSPMAALYEYAPTVGMARRLEIVSRELEKGSYRDGVSDFLTEKSKVRTIEEEASKYRRLNDEWLATLNEIRMIDRFCNFLRPRQLSDFRPAASNGPIVLVNVTNTTSDALILTLDGVQHVPLPKLGLFEVNKLVILLQSVLDVEGRKSEAYFPSTIEDSFRQLPAFSRSLDLLRAGRVASSRKFDADDIFRFVLSALWENIVQPIISTMKLQKSINPRNLRWCPTGPSTFLPIHAAGNYSKLKNESVMDYMISSYTPTITALLPNPKLHSSNPSQETLNMMVVIQSQTLPFAMQELQVIKTHIAEQCRIDLGIPGTPATVKDVASHLSAVSLVHFACHGHQDPRDPLKSSLALHDGRLTISSIMKHMNGTKNASLAFLCACETAMGNKKLPDEVLHLGAALLYSGFRGVVATLWSIADVDGPRVADTFYAHISERDGTAVDVSKGTEALHLSILNLRSGNVPFARWVPFIYVGL